mmetsp:Transcript_180381/g.572491  ORF Transcript_180381/g.572491 Transcript_180381/m.572491 type:complete len:202 (+) Transcript_180381:485-1090(+)
MVAPCRVHGVRERFAQLLVPRRRRPREAPADPRRRFAAGGSGRLHLVGGAPSGLGARGGASSREVPLICTLGALSSMARLASGLSRERHASRGSGVCLASLRELLPFPSGESRRTSRVGPLVGALGCPPLRVARLPRGRRRQRSQRGRCRRRQSGTDDAGGDGSGAAGGVVQNGEPRGLRGSLASPSTIAQAKTHRRWGLP